MAEPRQLVPIGQARNHRPWATRRYLRTLISTDRIPFHKMGERENSPIYIDLRDLDKFVEAVRVEATKGPLARGYDRVLDDEQEAATG